MSAELEAARAALAASKRVAEDDPALPTLLADVQANAAVAQAAALERIAAWLENVQLADLAGAEDMPEDWDKPDFLRPASQPFTLDEPGESPPPTREQRERAEAESYWGSVEVGDEMRVEWLDGYVGSIAKSAPDQPLHPQVARVRRS